MTKNDKGHAAAINEENSLIVYGREECHLCLDMIAALQELQKQRCFSFTFVDIDDDPTLKMRYGEKIPVLTSSGDQEICHYYLDIAVLDAYLDKVR